MYNTLYLAMQEIGKGGVELVIGKILGFPMLGLYRRANGYRNISTKLTLDAVLPVMQASLAGKNSDGDRMDRAYLRAIALFSGIGLPAFLFLASMSGPLILFLFGDQWGGAVITASILCVLGAINGISSVNNQLMLAMGEIKQQFKIAAIVQPAKLLMVVCLSHLGIEKVALGLVVMTVVQLALTQAYVYKPINVGMSAWSFELLRSAGVAAITMAGPLAIVLAQSDMPLLYQVVAGTFIGGIGWSLAIFVTKHQLRGEINVVIRNVLPYLHKMPNRGV